MKHMSKVKFVCTFPKNYLSSRSLFQNVGLLMQSLPLDGSGGVGKVLKADSCRWRYQQPGGNGKHSVRYEIKCCIMCCSKKITMNIQLIKKFSIR